MQTPATRAATRLAIVLVMVGTVIVGCSDDASEGPNPTDGASSTTVVAEPVSYAEVGPHAVGVTTVQIPRDDPAAAPRDVVVWYPTTAEAVSGKDRDIFRISDLLPADLQSIVPADLNPELVTNAVRDVPGDPTGGPYPIFVYAHGFGGHPSEYQQLLTHVASWGFVVVAPYFDERGLLTLLQRGERRTIDEGKVMLDAAAHVRSVASSSDSVLSEMVAADGKIVVGGHSAGTGSAYQASSDPSVVGMELMSGGGFRQPEAASSTTGAVPATNPALASLVITGSLDEIVSADSVEASYQALPTPKLYALFDRAGHLSFTDICTIGREQGGLVAIAEKVGLLAIVGEEGKQQVQALGGDGCDETKWITAEDSWPASQHLTVAFIRWRLGLDPAPSNLEPAFVESIGPAEVKVTSELGA